MAGLRGRKQSARETPESKPGAEPFDCVFGGGSNDVDAAWPRAKRTALDVVFDDLVLATAVAGLPLLARPSDATAQERLVPETAGMTFGVAAQLIRRHLDAGVAKQHEESATVPPERVISTDPPVRSVWDPQATKTVTVYVSSGRSKSEQASQAQDSTPTQVQPSLQMVEIPSFKPQPHERFVATLKKAGFQVEHRWSEPSNLPAGYFTRTEPSAGTRVYPGSEVTVRYSNGPQQDNRRDDQRSRRTAAPPSSWPSAFI
jgi:beta-lactam-binding protein with PASTA domain